MILAIILGLALMVGSISAVFLKHDSVPEQIAEKVILDETGIELDFSEED